MKIKILTLFPSMFDGILNESIIKRTIGKGIVDVEIIDFRIYSKDKHHKVDDTPYGGGAGMVISPVVINDALNDVRTENSHVILTTPQGLKYDQKMATWLATLNKDIIIICGHYEGFDERVNTLVDEEVSIGDYVLTGGEIAAMAIADSIIRLLDGAINKESYMTDSHQNGLLEYPQYTRPKVFNGIEVPFVLQNGNHKEIARWRLKESLRKTLLRRPDLLENKVLSKEEKEILEEIKKELH